MPHRGPRAARIHAWRFRHGNTYSGHATAAATALANLGIVQRENLPDNARTVGAHFLAGLQRLQRHAIVGDVRGVGLVARIELVRDKTTKQQLSPVGATGTKVQQRAQELGVIFAMSAMC